MVRDLICPGLVIGFVLSAGMAAAGEDLVAKWERADSACGLPASAMTEQACQDRQRYADRLRRTGWCEAAPTTPFEHWGWQRCVSRAAPPSRHGRRHARART